MRQSRLFQKTTKDISQSEVSLNAQLLTRAGYINKLMAGVYSYQPLGLKVINKIANIVRDEMNKIGGNEVLMPVLHPKEIWEKTNRYEMDVLFKLKGSGDKDLALGPTHEEVVTPLAQTVLSSYKDLPAAPYQIQTKFRNEARAKSGILRGREFIMKDMYSFHMNEEDHDIFYEDVTQAYHNVFKRCGLGELTVFTYADGGDFCPYSHEFQAISETGEDTIYLIPGSNAAINKEIIEDYDAVKDLIPGFKPGDEKKLKTVKAIEIGNIFKLGTRFSKAFNMTVADENGKPVTPLMGCYGIGISRLMGTIAECLSDDKGLAWPVEIAPFAVHIIPIAKSEETSEKALKVYDMLNNNGIETLIDDRPKLSPGIKMKDADLMGMPYQLIISDKTLQSNSAELINRKTGETKLISLNDIVNEINKLLK